MEGREKRKERGKNLENAMLGRPGSVSGQTEEILNELAYPLPCSQFL